MWLIKTTLNSVQFIFQCLFRLFWPLNRQRLLIQPADPEQPQQDQVIQQEEQSRFQVHPVAGWRFALLAANMNSSDSADAEPRANPVTEVDNALDRTVRTTPKQRTFFNIQKVLGTGQWGVVFHVTRVGTEEAEEVREMDLGEFSLSVDSTELENLREWPSQNLVLKIMKKRGVMRNKLGPQHAANEQMLCDGPLSPKANSNPFVIKMLASFQTPERVCFLMEHCEGGDLYYLMEHKKWFKEEWCFFYLAEVLHALNYLHRAQICYSDLKPENVCLANDGHVKLIDFGLSRHMGWSGQRRTSFVGTREYMSPEIYKGAGHSFPTDVWSMGAMGFELFYGYLPVSNGKYHRVRFLPRADNLCPTMDFVRFMHDCLHPEEEDRSTTKELMGHSFFLSRFDDWSVVSSKSLVPPYIPERDGLVGGLLNNEEDARVRVKDLKNSRRDLLNEDQELLFKSFRDVDAKFNFPGCNQPTMEDESPDSDESPWSEEPEHTTGEGAVKRFPDAHEESDDDLEGAIFFTA